MKSIFTYFLSLLFLVLSPDLIAQSEKNKKSDKRTEIDKPKTVFDRKTIKMKCDEILKELKTKRMNVKTSMLNCYVMDFKNFQTHDGIEDESQISMKWYLKVGKILENMHYYRSINKHSLRERKFDIADKAMGYYLVLLEKLEKNMKRPIKVKKLR